MDAHQRRLERIALLVLGVLFVIGVWQGYGVLVHGIEGSYAH